GNSSALPRSGGSCSSSGGRGSSGMSVAEGLPGVIGERFSHYEIVRELGSGGMGVGYLSRGDHLRRDGGVKILAPGALADETTRKRFRREAHLLAKRNHPNIVAARDFDTENGIDFLVMEYVPGESLEERLRHGPLPEPEILDLGSQLLRAIAAAH